MNIHYCAPVIYCKLFFFKIFDVIFSIAKGVQHDGRLPFWKPASVFAHYVRKIIVFAIGEINILYILLFFFKFITCSHRLGLPICFCRLPNTNLSSFKYSLHEY